MSASLPSQRDDLQENVRLFSADVEFLKQHGDITLLEAPHGARVAVSAKYQARVMTSAVSAAGASLGWVNRAQVSSGKTGLPFDNYGGEDRFWLGPEGGQFSVFFRPGAPFELSHWQTPSGFQEGTWDVSSQGSGFASFERRFQVTNASGTRFDAAVKRRIELLDATAVSRALGVALPQRVEWVAYRSDNELTNAGQQAWTEQTGLVSIWSLGMFVPADDTWVVVPFAPDGQGRIVSSDYFGELSEPRLQVDASHRVVKFLADGRYRSKIGLSQSRSRPVAGSYTRSERRLTLIRYSMPAEPRPYVNSKWELQAEPYAGDLFNSYNHGTLEAGKLAEVRFYELESSSPGAALAPGAALSHEQQTFHFVGDEPALDEIASRVLGISLSLIGG
ncbi:MAG TPA: DUF6786 family protein [Polyangiaceae bacterium]|nr:DUF6786 family protein [Polyangiaceae bacterium]